MKLNSKSISLYTRRSESSNSSALFNFSNFRRQPQSKARQLTSTPLYALTHSRTHSLFLNSSRGIPTCTNQSCLSFLVSSDWLHSAVLPPQPNSFHHVRPTAACDDVDTLVITASSTTTSLANRVARTSLSDATGRTRTGTRTTNARRTYEARGLRRANDHRPRRCD